MIYTLDIYKIKLHRESIQYIPVDRYVQLGHYVSIVHLQVLIKMKLKIICMCMHTILACKILIGV